MIVIYAWRTQKIVDHIVERSTNWRGLFLFGFIPLAIWTTSKTWRVR